MQNWKPKVGDWVVLLTDEKEVNWTNRMESYVNLCVKLTSYEEESEIFRINEDEGVWAWEYSGRVKHFRKAELHEIPGYVKFKETYKYLIPIIKQLNIRYERVYIT
jgi:hypothetical protein